MRRKLARERISQQPASLARRDLRLTICLSGFNLLQQTLEPAERGCVTANPEELDTAERADVALTLTIPDVLEDGRKRCDTNTGTNKDGDFTVEHVFSGSTIWSIDADDREWARSTAGVNLDEVTAGSIHRLVLLGSLHCSLGQRGNNRRACANTFTEAPSPVTNLTDMDRDIRVFRGRCNCKLM